MKTLTMIKIVVPIKSIHLRLRRNRVYQNIIRLGKSIMLSKYTLNFDVTALTYLPPLSLGVFGYYTNCTTSSFLLDGLFFVLLILTLLGLFISAQDYLLYYPNQPEDARHIVPTPEEYDLNYESITITTSDGTQIHAFLLKTGDDCKERPTLIMFHGNAGNIGHRLPNAAHLVHNCNINVLLMEYRGYGLSGGDISEPGLYDDAVSTVRYVKNRADLNSKLIILHGRSLGGAVAIYVASLPEFSDLFGVMLENTFTSLPEIAGCVLNLSIIKLVPVWCYKNKYPSIDRIGKVTQPTLFLTGRADTLVPPKHMDRLAMASGSIRKEISSFPKGTHNETWTEPGYFFAISNFIRQNM